MDITLLRTFSSTRRIKTGTWSRLQPVFLNGVSPCMDACPASIDMPRIYGLFLEGKEKEAALSLLAFNPFPSITGRVCPHFCQEKCNRKELDEPVQIRALERYLGDLILEEGIFPPKELFHGPPVAVVGSGPAGLAAAWYLALGGMEVVLFEKEEVAGGILAWGIPSFRLEREVVQGNIRRLEEIGVTIVTSSPVTPQEMEKLKREFQGVIVAPGLTRARELPVEGREYTFRGLDLLKAYNLEGKLPSGERAVVVGGGNVAVDVARVLVREGRRVTLVCVEPKEEMPAIPEEIQDAVKEGVVVRDSTGLEEVLVQDGRVIGVRVGSVRIVGEEDRFKEVEFVDQSREELPCDLVILAVGQEAQESWAGSGLTLAGDFLTGPSSVVQAIASGRDAALAFNAELRGESFSGVEESLWQRNHREIITFQDLNPFYLEPAPPVEVKDKESALKEAQRCFSCGYCNACGNCWIFCPDVAIILESEPRLDKDHCKGCGICATECPRGVIYMREKG
ncbi:MAG TPA: FAD-binding protein [Thermosulfidibacter takaii]|uniref:FAD-binding protein n=1 Tax=Thermosulfidibacter takaii TaxID=412593 RepID=A0A7C0U613_9BACT|nr:FAD-binding protein [Thermosulfidibacter takaii]